MPQQAQSAIGAWLVGSGANQPGHANVARQVALYDTTSQHSFPDCRYITGAEAKSREVELALADSRFVGSSILSHSKTRAFVVLGLYTSCEVVQALIF